MGHGYGIAGQPLRWEGRVTGGGGEAGLGGAAADVGLVTTVRVLPFSLGKMRNLWSGVSKVI